MGNRQTFSIDQAEPQCNVSENSAKSAVHGFASGAVTDMKTRYLSHSVPSIHLWHEVDVVSDDGPLGCLCSPATCAETAAL